jgi:hypothetical protein
MEYSHKRTYYGVKSINGFYDVKEIRLPEDVSRVSEFDFILQDTQTESEQRGLGQESYVNGQIEVMTEFDKPALINGWKLNFIVVHGRWPKLNMTDKFGETSIVEKDGFGQEDYNYNKPAYIHDLLVVGRDFTKKYLSAKHKKFFSGLQGYVPNVDNEISVSQLVPLMEKIQNYAIDYQDILSFLKEESAPQEMIDQLNSAYNNVISKYFKFGIKFDE